MARKTKTVIIQQEGRDNGKHFYLTEMPASQAEKWAARAFLALAHAGVELPKEVAGMGMAALAVVGLNTFAGVSWTEAEPLMDEMMLCVQVKPDPAKHPELIRGLVEDDIEEVVTRALLKTEVLELHTGFSLAAYLSDL
jgi:hypothetical protein